MKTVLATDDDFDNIIQHQAERGLTLSSLSYDNTGVYTLNFMEAYVQTRTDYEQLPTA